MAGFHAMTDNPYLLSAFGKIEYFDEALCKSMVLLFMAKRSELK